MPDLKSDLKNKQLTVSVGLVERNAKFLLTKRVAPHHADWHQRWEFPGGKIAAGETPLEALYREIQEETNLKITQPRLLGVHTQYWNIPNGVQQTFVLFYHCYALEGNALLNPAEHSEYCWNTLEEIMLKEDLLDGTLTMLKNLYS